MLRRIVKGFQYFRELIDFPETPKRLSIEDRAYELKKNFDKLEAEGRPSLLKAMYYTFWRSYSICLVMKTIQLFCSLGVSICVMQLTEYF